MLKNIIIQRQLCFLYDKMHKPNDAVPKQNNWTMCLPLYNSRNPFAMYAFLLLFAHKSDFIDLGKLFFVSETKAGLESTLTFRLFSWLHFLDHIPPARPPPEKSVLWLIISNDTSQGTKKYQQDILRCKISTKNIYIKCFTNGYLSNEVTRAQQFECMVCIGER